MAGILSGRKRERERERERERGREREREREPDVHYARGTPLTMSSKKYCRDVTIASHQGRGKGGREGGGSASDDPP